MVEVSLKDRYLLDTHAIVFWQQRENMPVSLQTMLDHAAVKGLVLISSISFWEIALLVKKGRLEIDNVTIWKNDILRFSNVQLISPDVGDMISSANLPSHHKDPFDRLLVAQATREKAILVTKDSDVVAYGTRTVWDF